MLMPKKVKFRKQHRGHRRGKASGGVNLDFGDFGLQALESCWMTANQIEAARIAMTRHMGSGKGAPEGWVAVVKPGRMLFEMAGVTEELAREAMRLASHKLPIDVKFVVREKQDVESSEDEPAPPTRTVVGAPAVPSVAPDEPGLSDLSDLSDHSDTRSNVSEEPAELEGANA